MKNDRFHNRLAEKVANRLQAREFVSSDLPFRPSVPQRGFCSEERQPGKAQDGLRVEVGYSDLSTPRDFHRLGQNMAFFIGKAARQNAVTWISFRP